MKYIGQTLWTGTFYKTIDGQIQVVNANSRNTVQAAFQFAVSGAEADGYCDAAALLDTGDAVLDLSQSGSFHITVRIREVLSL